MNRMIRIGLLGVAGVATLSGCTVGSSEFTCPGVPKGMACQSTRDVYQRTEGSMDEIDDASSKPKQPSAPRVVGGGRKQTTASSHQRTPTRSGATTAGGDRPGRAARSAVSTQRERVTPVRQREDLPIRKPAQVMRIWVAPWEDRDGNLHMSGLIYTEIVKRRWSIGVPRAEGGGVTRPLTAPTPRQSNSTSASSAEQSARSQRGSNDGS